MLAWLPWLYLNWPNVVILHRYPCLPDCTGALLQMQRIPMSFAPGTILRPSAKRRLLRTLTLRVVTSHVRAFGGTHDPCRYPTVLHTLQAQQLPPEPLAVRH